MAYNNDDNREQFPNAEDSIIIETADSFSPAVTRDADGKRSYFSIKPVTRKEVVEKFYWNEREILAKEVEQGKLTPAFAPSVPDDNDDDFDADDEADEGISYSNGARTNRKDEWQAIVGNTPDWSDINEDTIEEE